MKNASQSKAVLLGLFSTMQVYKNNVLSSPLYFIVSNKEINYAKSSTQKLIGGMRVRAM